MPSDARAVRPHEVVFGGFLAFTALRLTWVAGLGCWHTWEYAALLATDIALIQRHRARPTAGRDRARLLFHAVAMNWCFMGMGGVVAALGVPNADPALQHADAWLVGTNLSVRCEAITTPVLTELFSGCYLLFFPYLLFSLVYYGCGDLALGRRCFAGLFTIYGIGFLGYSHWPAVGPWVAMAHQFTVPLQGWALTPLNDAIVTRGSNGVDVFPSLHCAVSAYLLWFDFRHKRWRFRAYVVPCVGLWCSTVYLRYHYFVDVGVGFGLAATAAALVRTRRPPEEAAT